MTQSGRSLLDLMQSHSINSLDLLVRESLQNSLDASKDRVNKSHVDVDFISGKFNTTELCREFSFISERIKRRYPLPEYDFLAIRDSGTFGLTGTNSPDDDRSRLQSLIYQISKNQQVKGSGGNWGLGKTTYFRFGIGLVIYYSRTFEGGRHHSKLAASLVENEEGQPLVIEPGYRGISFFGRYVNPESDIHGVTVPLSNPEEISEILDIFSLSEYEGYDTGTTIIIPFIDFEKHLKEMRPDIQPGERESLWTKDIGSCLKILIQRWYAPRIANPRYRGSWLKPSVNGVLIRRSEMEPLFSLIQDLYNYSVNSNDRSELIEELGPDVIKSSPIACKSVSGQIGGHIASAYVGVGQLGLTTEFNRNAYALIGEPSASSGLPIVTFTRSPGMLIRYDTRFSPWVPANLNVDDDKILVCVFRLDSDRKLNDH